MKFNAICNKLCYQLDNLTSMFVNDEPKLAECLSTASQHVSNHLFDNAKTALNCAFDSFSGLHMLLDKDYIMNALNLYVQ